MPKTLYFVSLDFDFATDIKIPKGFKVKEHTVIDETLDSYEMPNEGLGRSYAHKQNEFKGDKVVSLNHNTQLPYYVTDISLIPAFKQYLKDYYLFNAIKDYQAVIDTHNDFVEEFTEYHNKFANQLVQGIGYGFSIYKDELERNNDSNPENYVLYSSISIGHGINTSVELMWISAENEEDNTYELTDESGRPCLDVSRNIGEVEVGNEKVPFASICIRQNADIVDTTLKLLNAFEPLVRENLKYKKLIFDDFIRSITTLEI